MPNVLYHEEIGDGYAAGTHIILVATDFRETDGNIRVMALNETAEYLDLICVQDEAEAKVEFDKLVNKYAEEFQRAMYNAGLVSGKKYTLVYLNKFGFPVSQKIAFDSMRLKTYAQCRDVVQMICRPFRKRAKYRKYFCNGPLMIFDGWQDSGKDVLHHLEDAERFFKNPVMIYKNCKTRASGKLYT